MAKVNTSEMKRMIIRIAGEEGVPANVMLAIAEHESGFDPNAKNFSPKEKSYGMFQINTKAHPDYKGGFNPEANTRYACRFFKRLLKQNNGNVAKAIERYNGSGQDARNYAKKVINNVLPKYKNVANNASQIATNVNDKTLKGGVSQTDMQQQNIQPQQSASDKIMGNLQGEYFSLDYPTMNVSDYTGGVSQNKLVNQAISKETPESMALKQFYSGLKTFDELNAQFPQLVQKLGITPDQERQSPSSQYTRDLNDKVLNNLMPTEEQIQNAQTRILEQNKQLSDIATNRDVALNKLMSDAYTKQLNTINQNPYSVSNVNVPAEEYKRALQLQDRYNTFYALQGKQNPLNFVDEVTKKYTADKNIELINRYGANLEEAKQMAITQYNNQVAAAKQNVENAKYQYQIGNITSQQLMKIIADQNTAVNNARVNAGKNYADYAKAVVPDMYKADVDLMKEIQSGNTDINKQAGTNAKDIANKVIEAQSGLNEAQLKSATDVYNTQVGANTQMYNTNVGALTEAAKLDQNQQQFIQGLPAKYADATGTLLQGAGIVPNIDVQETAKQFGINVPQRKPISPKQTSPFGGLNGVMYNLYKDRLNQQ